MCLIFEHVSATDLKCLECEGEHCLRTSVQNNSVTCSGSCVAVFDQCKYLEPRTRQRYFVELWNNKNRISVTLQRRGCLSALSATDQSACNLASNTTCYTCDTDLCNNMGRVDHTCLVCSSATDSKCLNEPLSVNRTRCPSSLATDALCFTKLVMSLCFFASTIF